MNIAILGPQGSGKGTQAQLLIDKFGFSHVETGKILRDISHSDSPLANDVKEMLMSGKLVSDDILEKVLTEKLSVPSEVGYVFDGTPRNIEQYNLLKYLLTLLDQKLDRVIVVDIPEEETIRRISSRRTCSKCGRVYNVLTNPSPNGDHCECGEQLIQREDDTPEAIKKRLEMYHVSTLPVVTEAEKDGILLSINGNRPIEEIHNEILAKINL